MGALEGILFGLEVALTPENLLAALIGALAGTLVGLLPGLGPIAGASILLPLTFTMSPTAGVIMLAGIYYGVMYGGSTTAVLLNIPGEAPSVVASFDGYEMTKQGRAGPALGIIAFGSFIAGTLSVVGVTLFAPALSRVALQFGPAEFFALTAGGLLLLSRLLGGSMASGLVPMIMGVAFATVGEEAVTGSYRFTFGYLEMARGINIVPVAIGMFGLTELIIMSEQVGRRPTVESLKFRDLLPSKNDWKRAAAPYARGGLLGFGMGLLPGPSTTMATFLSYRLEKAVSRNRKEIGKGAVEGIAGPEAANNAAATSSMVPVLALGIPFSATLALILAALIAQGITPGPLIMTQFPEIFWGVIASMYIGNVILLALNLPAIRLWVALLKVPTHVLIPLVLFIAVFGAYSARGNMLDVYVALSLGVIGYVFRKLDFQPAPLLVGIILGPLMEKHLREGLFLSNGDPSFFWGSGLAMTIWGVAIAGIVGPFFARLIGRRTGRGGMSTQAMAAEAAARSADGPATGMPSNASTDDEGIGDEGDGASTDGAGSSEDDGQDR